MVNWCMAISVAKAGRRYLGGGNIGRRADPFDSVPDFLNGIDKRANVAGDIVEKVDGRHGCKE